MYLRESQFNLTSMKSAAPPCDILLIEPDTTIRMLIEDFIDEFFLKYNIEFASGLKESETLLNGSKLPDVIICNSSLPNENATELIRKLLDLCGDIPLIVLNSYTNRQEALKWVKMGIADYLLLEDLSASLLHKSIVFSLERRKSLMELQQSERRYRDLFEYSPLPMWVIELDSGNILDVNQAAVEAYGYTPEELSKLNLRTIYPEMKTQDLRKWLSDSRSGSVAEHGVFEHHSKTGEVMQMDVKSQKVDFQGKPARLIIAHDVTRLKSYINAIEEQNERFKEIGWLQSHIVRAPLARMLGLMDTLKDYDEGSEPSPEMSREDILQYIAEAAAELDQNVRDVVSKTTRTELD